MCVLIYIVCNVSHVENYGLRLLKQRQRGHLFFRPPETLRQYLTGRSDMDNDAAGRLYDVCLFVNV